MDPYFYFEIGRSLFIKGVMVCFFLANVSLIKQITAILGHRGIIPVDPFLSKIKQ